MLKKEHLKNVELHYKKLQVPVISVYLEGNKEKIYIDTGTSASFVAAECCVQYTMKTEKDSLGYEIRLLRGEKHLVNDFTMLTLGLW